MGLNLKSAWEKREKCFHLVKLHFSVRLPWIEMAKLAWGESWFCMKKLRCLLLEIPQGSNLSGPERSCYTEGKWSTCWLSVGQDGWLTQTSAYYKCRDIAWRQSDCPDSGDTGLKILAWCSPHLWMRRTSGISPCCEVFPATAYESVSGKNQSLMSVRGLKKKKSHPKTAFKKIECILNIFAYLKDYKPSGAS